MKRIYFYFWALCLMTLATSCKEEFVGVNNIPVLELEEPTNMGRSSVTLNGSIKTGHPKEILEYGFLFGSTSDFSKSDTRTISIKSNSLYYFSAEIDNLSMGETYFYALYVDNGISRIVSAVQSLTMPSVSEVIIKDLKMVNSSTATFSARIADDGGGKILNVGFCWSKEPYPTIKTAEYIYAEFNSSNIFSASLPGWEEHSSYYVRAFAESDIIGDGSAALFYSDEMRFTAEDIIQIIYTSTDGEIVTPNADSFGVNILSNVYKDGYGIIAFDAPVTTIGENAFKNCKTLKSIIIPESVILIGNSAFYGCSGLYDIQIGKSVTAFEDSAFYNCSNLTDIIIPDNVRIIGGSCFKNNSNLQKVVIGSNVEKIGDGAFYKCAGLKDVVLPDNLVEIGEDAFYCCSKLENLTMGAGITTIKNDAFQLCNNLKRVNIYDLTAWCKISFGNINSNPLETANALYYNDEIIVDLVIPYGVETIKNYAFVYNLSLNSLTISDSVTSIGDHAFYNCSNLNQVYIPNSVKNIGDVAFAGCTGELCINCNISSKDEDGYGAFWNSNFYKVTFGDSISTIGDRAFASSEELTEIVIPNNVQSIGEEAFRSCEKLSSVTIGNGCKSVGKSAFSYCENLEVVRAENLSSWCGIYFESATSNPLCYAKKLYVGGVELTDLTIPDDVTSIGHYTFYNCSNLTRVTIPNHVTSFGERAFYNCSGELYVYCDIPNKFYEPSLYNGAFCEADFESAFISDGVALIGVGAFAKCDKLKYITIPNSVTTIENRAFFGCENLKEIIIPDGVRSIEDYVFNGCTSLSNTEIPSSVTYIGDNAFCGCISLSNIEIPNGVTYIGDNAFFNTALKGEIRIPESVSYIGKSVFSSCYDISGFYGKFASEDNRSLIVGGMLKSFAPSGITEYVIPEGVTIIEQDVFYGCVDLLSVVFPNSLSVIQDYAFCQCYRIRDILLPDNLISIGAGAFESCESLTKVTIGKSCTEIGDRAFAFCSNLVSVYCKPVTPPSIFFNENYGDSAPSSFWQPFTENAPNRKIYVPKSAVNAYSTAEGWDKYASAIVGYSF